MNQQNASASTSTEQSSFVFNVEVLINSKNNAIALEQLLHALNNCDFLDYRVLSGIKLGEQIDKQKENASSVVNVPLTSESNSGFEPIRALMKSNALIRLIVNKGLGIMLNIPCRIINMDEKDNLITVYHVDEKQVYTFRLNEIEDFSY